MPLFATIGSWIAANKLLTASIVLTAATTTHTVLTQKRQRQELLDERTRQTRFGIRETPSGGPVLIPVGDCYVQAVPVDWHQAKDWPVNSVNNLRDASFSRPGGVTASERSHVKGDNATTFGAIVRAGFAEQDRTYLFVPYVIGGLDAGTISDVKVNGKAIRVSAFVTERRASSIKGHALFEAGVPGTPSVMATNATSMWSDSKFTDLAFGYLVAKQDNLNPQLATEALPRIELFLTGAGRWRDIDATGFGALGHHNDLPTIVAGIATHSRLPLGLDDSDIAFDLFNTAKVIARRELPDPNDPLDSEVEEEEGYGDGMGGPATTYGQGYVARGGPPGGPPPGYKPNIAHRESLADKMLIRYECNGVFEADQSFRSIWARLSQVAPGSFLFQRLDGKLGIKVPDSETVEASQAVRTIRDADLVQPITVTGGDQLHNQGTFSFPSASQAYGQDVRTWPASGAPALSTFLAEDGERLTESYDMAFVNNEFAAYTAGGTSVILSRREFYTVPLKAWAIALELGDILDIQAQGLSLYAMVMSVGVDDGQVNVIAQRFVRSDHAWRPNAETATVGEPVVAIDVSPPTAVSLTVSADARVADVGFVVNEARTIDVTGFNVELSRDNGVTWVGWGTVGPDERGLSTAIGNGAQQLAFRIQTVEGNRYSKFVQSAVVDVALIRASAEGIPVTVYYVGEARDPAEPPALPPPNTQPVNEMVGIYHTIRPMHDAVREVLWGVTTVDGFQTFNGPTALNAGSFVERIYTRNRRIPRRLPTIDAADA